MNFGMQVNKIKILLTREEAKWPLSRVFQDFRPLEPAALQVRLLVFYCTI